MDTHDRLQQLMDEKGWTPYKLAKACGLAESTIINQFERNTAPTIRTLEAVCDAFGITLSQFFSNEDTVEMSPALQELFDSWGTLSADQKEAVLNMMQVFTLKE